MSLGQMFSGEITPDEIWDYLEYLPQQSALRAAVYADPETVIGDGPAPEPRLTEFSPEMAGIADLNDKISSLLAVVMRLGGGKPPKFEPYPRPGDARRVQLKAARQDQARQEWAEVLGQLGISQ